MEEEGSGQIFLEELTLHQRRSTKKGKEERNSMESLGKGKSFEVSGKRMGKIFGKGTGKAKARSERPYAKRRSLYVFLAVLRGLRKQSRQVIRFCILQRSLRP